MPDYCANCGDELRELPTGGRVACAKFHGGNTGFYLTTVGPPQEPNYHGIHELRWRDRVLYLYGAKKGRVTHPWRWDSHPAYIRVKLMLSRGRA